MAGVEIETFLKLCGAAVLTVIVLAVLNELRQGVKLPVKLCGTVLMYGGVLLLFLPLISKLKALSEGYVLKEYGELMLKALGIALLSQIVSDLCRDIGEGTVASVVEMAGKAVILLLAFPLIESLLKIVEGLL